MLELIHKNSYLGWWKTLRNKEYYMGVDIAEGSPMGKRPYYAVVIIDENGKIITLNPSAPLSRIIRLAWDYRPKKIGLDNPLEIASNKKELEKILSMFPTDVEIVQVNIDIEGNYKKLAAIAREKGILRSKGKPDPISTAYALAYLAMKGEGKPIREVEEKTLIIVSKARSPTGGGYSQQRLQRRVRASVHIAAMRVKQALDEAGLEYDMNYRKSVGGLESAVFTVYTSREKLRGIVKPHRGVDYNIIIKPLYKVKLSLEKEKPAPTTPLIVGIDPGITTGIAVIDLNGKIVLLDSGKNYDRGEIVRILSEIGKPILFAVDVAEIPESVRWIAAKFGAQIYSPSQDLEAGEKRELAARILGKPPVDTHQRDALAAAYKAYLIVKNKLETIEKQLRKMGIELNSTKIKEEVIKGVTVAEAIEKAIDEKITLISGKDKYSTTLKVVPKKHIGEGRTHKTYNQELIAKIQELKAENQYLHRKINEMEKKLKYALIETEAAKRRIKSELLKDNMIRELKEQVSTLNNKIEEMQSKVENLEYQIKTAKKLLIKMGKGELILARHLQVLTSRALKNSLKELGPIQENEVIILEEPGVPDPSALRIIREKGILGIVLLKGDPAHYLGYGIPTIRGEVGNCIYLWNDLAFICEEIISNLLEVKDNLEKERSSYIDIERIIEEYRRVRIKGKRS